MAAKQVIDPQFNMCNKCGRPFYNDCRSTGSPLLCECLKTPTPQVGWICPKCGSGVNPNISVCPCNDIK